MRTRTSQLCVFVIGALLLLSLSDVHAAIQRPPTAQILSVAHPNGVSPGTRFEIAIVANYSDRLLADVGIWDSGRGEMIQSVTLISQFTGPGNATFTFQLTAPANDGTWNLTAVTRVWWKNAWYQDPRGAMLFAVVVSNLVTLTLTAQGADSTVTLDGVRYEVAGAKSVTVQVPLGTHSLGALPTIQGERGERFVFAGWSDGVRSNPRQVQVTSATSIAALYGTEYYLSVLSDIGGVVGSGWYEKGYPASFAVIPNYTVSGWSGLLFYDYRFSKWSGDRSSGENTATVLMNGPKSVKAEFAQSGTRLDLTTVSAILLVASVVLAARRVYIHTKGKRTGIGRAANSLGRSLIPLLAIGIMLVASINLPDARAQVAFRPNVSPVKIGDASWYYWNQATSDTCILWLGGGISQQTYSGYNYYWINPFEYESFGTQQFIQDLGNYYCVIALQEGAYATTVPGSNRTINQELYEIQSTMIADVHNWIKTQGYQHTFLVGYSVGAQAAATEIALRDPEAWTGSDGLVLITVPLLDRIIDHAQNINTNLMFLYGGNLPDFVATGQEFYDNAPSEGWKGTYYYHKEFHVLTDVGHEVWTVRETGAYTRRALNMIANFIETSKALQIGSVVDLPIVENSQVRIFSLHFPYKIATGTIFQIEGNVTYATTSKISAGMIAYDAQNNQTVSVTFFDLTGQGARIFPLVMPPISNSSTRSYRLCLLMKTGDTWFRVEPAASIEVIASDSITLTIESNVPNLTVLIDGSLRTLSPTGVGQFEIGRGLHSVQVVAVIPVGDTERFIFTQWDDGIASPQRQILIEDETRLAVFYRTQYFASASSPYGVVQGSGWYDANSTATMLLQPIIIEREGVIFAHWKVDSSDTSPRTLIPVDSPKVVEAQWDSFGNASQSATGLEFTWLPISLTLFVILLLLNLSRPKRKLQT